MTGTDLSYAAALLQQGSVVAIPTETVYGLAANAYDAAAVQKIYTIKGRPATNPLIVHTDSLDKLAALVEPLPPLAYKLARRFWPGPLTLLLRKKERIPFIVTAGLPRVGVRMPNHPLTQQLLHILPFPLAAPSANPSNYLSPTTASHVAEQLGDQVPYILDGGPCALGLESTIIGFDDAQPTLHRLGAIPVEMIEKVVGSVQRKKSTPSQPLHAPGALPLHYAPRTPLIICDIPALLQRYPHKKVGILNFTHYTVGVPTSNQAILSKKGDLAEAARNLFAALHQLDQLQADVLLAAYLPDYGLGRTINERLARGVTKGASVIL